MVQPSKFIDFLYRAFRRSASKEKVKVQLSDSDVLILRSIIKCSYLNRKGSDSPTAANYLKRLEQLKVLTKGFSAFPQICSSTILVYRKHEDDIRLHDYLLKLSRNDLKNSKEDHRKPLNKKPMLTSVADVWDQMLEESKAGTYHIDLMTLFKPKLGLSEVRRRLKKFADQFDAVSKFYDEYYHSLDDGLPDHLKEDHQTTRYMLIKFRDELLTALETNTKSHAELDLFVFWTLGFLNRHGRAAVAEETLTEICIQMGLGKHLSTENLKDIRRNAKALIAKNPSLQRLQKKWGDLS